MRGHVVNVGLKLFLIQLDFFDLTSKHKLNFHAKANFGDISVLNATLVWTIRFVVLSGLSIVTGNVS